MPSGSLSSKALELQSMRRRQQKKLRLKKDTGVIGWNKRPKILMKRMLLESSRRHSSGVGKKVKSLKNLVPNGKSMELDGLFKETTDYIACLEIQIEIRFPLLESDS
ncbi:transcription factor UPBEAT1-like [Tasmannia lanceolata]|uniref:transcription factor UPBEAT1-like n=1 Tax=Tasmannia lanceolata TaxID=3420 RepID=UPI00406371BE